MMVKWTTVKIRSVTAAGLVGGALLVAACGSSASTSGLSTSAAAATAAASGTVAPASARGVSISTATGASGTHLTGASGRAIYLWEADTTGRSSCSGACAQAWPPVTSSGTAIAGHGVKAADLATIARSDGAKQVTYGGHPLYYFAGDRSAGSTTGQGSDGFGAEWWLVSPSGAAIDTGPAPGAFSDAASSSSSSSAGGGWG